MRPTLAEGNRLDVGAAGVRRWSRSLRPGQEYYPLRFDGVVSSVASDPIRKTWLAQQAGAVGILFVEDVHDHAAPRNFESAYGAMWPATPPRVEHWTLSSWADRATIPAAQISLPLAAEIAGMTPAAFAQLAASAEQATPPRRLGATVELAVSLDRHIVATRNIVGPLEGSDPTLKDEWVIVCAHHDHNGADGGASSRARTTTGRAWPR